MKKIRISFADYKRPFNPEDNLILDLLRRRYEVEFCDKPDFVIDIGLGHKYVEDEGSVKILVNGENNHPDFNFFDYAAGSDDISFGDRYYRLPHFAMYRDFAKMAPVNPLSDDELLNRGFCSFVVSRGTGRRGDPMRELFFNELSKYKKVDSGGRYLNNIGGPVHDKLEFCRRYKFHIAFENSSSPGYTTEKLMQAFCADTLPIYYGNPDVGKDFHPEAMVLVRDMDDVKRAIDEIIRLDKDDAAYLQRCRQARLVHTREWYVEGFANFLYSIFDREPPDARRLCPYGHIANYRKHIRKLYGYASLVKAPERALRAARDFLMRGLGRMGCKRG